MGEIRQKLQNLREDRFFENNLIFFSGSLAAAFGNYVFQSLMARFLSVEDYGRLQSLVAVTAIFAVPLTILSTALIGLAARFNKTNPAGLAGLFVYFSKRTLFLAAFLFVVFVVLGRFFASFLKVASGLILILLGLSFFPAFLSSVNRALLQGLERFKTVSLLGVFEVGTKILICFSLVALGFGLGGAVMGILVSSSIACLVTFLFLGSWRKGRESEVDFKEVLSYFFSVVSTVLALSLLFNLDLLLVKHFFSDTAAGEYSALTVVGRVVLFFVSPLVGVMFPMIARSQASESDVFKKTLVLTVFLGSSILAFYYVFPELAIRFFVGGRFLAAKSLLTGLSLAAFLYSLVNLFSQYFLSLGRKTFSYFLWFGVCLETVLIYCFHTHPLQVVAVTNLVLFFLLLVLVLYYKMEKRVRQVAG